ncbi:MAG TPA: hypothetical protein VLJ37_04425 [bacterium]|nr:hypothetical protein [bacterium]
MSPSLINPAAAPFFFHAFRAYPETGRMTVPVQMNPLSDAVEERTLTPRNVAGFANTLGLALSEITARFSPGRLVTPLPGDWTAIHNGPKRLLVENTRLGRALIFDRGGHLTERLTGHRSGAAIALRQCGIFASLEMSAAMSLKHEMRWLPHAYQIRFEACGMTGLKAFLGLGPEATFVEAGLALYHRAALIPAPEIQTGLMKEMGSPGTLDIEIEGQTARGDRVLICGGLDAASQLYGDNIEVLTLEVLPNDRARQNLPDTLHPVWALGLEIAERHRIDDEESEALVGGYKRQTLETYGPPDPFALGDN